jgi:class 3 adenylate cyclase
MAGTGLWFGVLGPLTVLRNGRSVSLVRPSERTLLAVLLSRREGIVPVDQLVEEIWGDAPPPSARTALRGHVRELRRQLDPAGPPSEVIVASRAGYRLAVEARSADALQFAELAERGGRALRAGAPELAATLLRRALALWRGEAYEDVPGGAAIGRERARLAELRQRAIEDSIEAEFALGSGPAATYQSARPAGGMAAGTVTFLFTDIEGSTRLVTRFRDGYGELLAEHRRLLREAFAQSSGREVDTQGDSFFFEFRTARDAVTAAVAAQRALAAGRWPEGGEVRVRMGIHTTEPVRRSAGYVGVGVHRASRICAAAHGGQIVLSSATYALVEDELDPSVRLRDLGEYQLRDFDRPERIWQLVTDGLREEFPALRTEAAANGAGGVDADDAGASSLAWLASATESRFVGRAEQLRVLEEARSRAASGHRVLALLGGEPGVGKTTLAARLATRAHAAGGLVLYGRWDEDVLAPYQAFRECLGEYSRVCPKAVLDIDLRFQAGEISRLFPEVADRIGASEAPLSGPAEAERYRLFEAIDAWLRAIAFRRPVLLVLDDLQWADRASLLLLRHLARAPRATPLLMIATYRDTELDTSELRGFLPTFTRDADCRRVPVGGLSVPETAELVAAELPERDPAFVGQLQQETAGNPFFLGEMVRHLRDAGPPEEHPAEPGPGTGPGLMVPETVRDVVGWRLGRLSRRCPEVLGIAALIGQEFDLDVLAAASGVDDLGLLDLLEEADDAGLVREVPDADARYVFAHSVVRRVLREEPSRPRRMRLHLRIAEALEGRPDTTSATLAYHYCEGASVEAGVADKAVRYARLAGDQAVAQAAHATAIPHYRRALAVADRQRPANLTLRAELLLALGGAHDGAGEFTARDGRFSEAADTARALERTDLFTRAALGYGGVLPAAAEPDPRARELLEEALGRLGAGDNAARAHALGRLAHWSHFSRPYAARREIADRSVALARSVGDPATLARALSHRCWALDGPRDIADEIAMAAEVVRLGEDLADHELVLDGLRVTVAARFEQGGFAVAQETGLALADLAGQLRHPEYERVATVWEIALAAVDGRYADADRLAEDLRARLERSGHAQAELIYVGQTFTWRVLQGRAGDYLPLFEGLAAMRPERAAGPALAAWCAAELGDTARVRQVLAAVTPAAALMDENYLWWMTIVGFSRAAALVGDRDWARALYDLALPFADHNATLGLAGFLGAAAHHLGVLAGVLGRWDDAAAHLAAALERHESMGARGFVALSQEAYAGVLTRRDAPGDRALARDLTAAARRAAGDLGLTSLAARLSA